jgi:hypothetical protein
MPRWLGVTPKLSPVRGSHVPRQPARGGEHLALLAAATGRQVADEPG